MIDALRTNKRHLRPIFSALIIALSKRPPESVTVVVCQKRRSRKRMREAEKLQNELQRGENFACACFDSLFVQNRILRISYKERKLVSVSIEVSFFFKCIENPQNFSIKSKTCTSQRGEEIFIKLLHKQTYTLK